MINFHVYFFGRSSDIQINNTQENDMKSIRGSLDEDTWVIIIIWVTLLQSIIPQSFMATFLWVKSFLTTFLLREIFPDYSYNDLRSTRYIHVVISIRIWNLHFLRNFHINVWVKWHIQICNHYIRHLDRKSHFHYKWY